MAIHIVTVIVNQVSLEEFHSVYPGVRIGVARDAVQYAKYIHFVSIITFEFKSKDNFSLIL